MSKMNRRFQAFCLLGIGIVLGRWTTSISIVAAQVSPADAGELMIGTVPVRLGVKKDVVLGTLGKQYKLEGGGQVADGVQLWVVRAIDTPKQLLGNVQFKQDRLVNASREWGELQAESPLVSFFEKVYGAFDSASSRTRIGTLNCNILREPDKTLTVLTFTFGNRRVSFFLSESRVLGEPYNSITIAESVRSPGNP
jgi:hypothetical protein